MEPAAAREARLERYVGRAIGSEPGCYEANDRYAACVVENADGELRAIRVTPLAWLRNEDFDRDRSLTGAEYLDVLGRLQRVVPFGSYRPDVEPAVSVVTNLAYDVNEWWSGAVVEKNVDLFDPGTIRTFTVFFFTRVRGRVVYYDKGCNTAAVAPAEESLFARTPRCQPEIGPYLLSVENRTYALAPEEWRCYSPGQTVDVLAVDRDPMRDLEQ